MALTHFDAFAGIGGWSLGFRKERGNAMTDPQQPGRGAVPSPPEDGGFPARFL
jgi:hypothetical protein